MNEHGIGMTAGDPTTGEQIGRVAHASPADLGRALPTRRADARTHVRREPVGPVAAFTPWNFPVTQIARKLSAALASGCSILVKAPKETPASPAALLQAFLDADQPAGVAELVFGDSAEISRHLIANPVIRKITFTGSTQVGKQLTSLAGLYMKRATMELGGHAPAIIDRDADLALAARTACVRWRKDWRGACYGSSKRPRPRPKSPLAASRTPATEGGSEALEAYLLTEAIAVSTGA